MFERLRFARYALAFERAFRTDDWTRVRTHFHPSGAYVIEGTGTRFDGEHRGQAAVVGVFKEMLDLVDRRYERRQVGLAAWPSVVDGQLVMPWKARYSIADQSARLTGTSYCRWSDGLILELRDVMVPAEVERWLELVANAV